MTLSFEGNPSPKNSKFRRKKTAVLGAPNSEDFVILACTVLIGLKGVTDGQTDRRPGHG